MQKPSDSAEATHDTSHTDRMWAGDRASRHLGIELVTVEPGHCTATMTIGDDHLNGLGVCHGGFLLTLADTAMAFASNASGVAAFATGIEIDFLAPGHPGRTITAVATTTTTAGRSAIHDAVLTDDTGTVVAITRGRTRLVPGGLAR